MSLELSPFVISALINAGVRAGEVVYNHFRNGGNLSKQEKRELETREFQERMEQNRLDFQLARSEENAQLQRELALENRRFRLEEQQANFENACKQIEWTRLVNTWPLTTIPSAVRAEQVDVNNPDAVALRVIFAKSNDPIFSKFVYPDIEHGIREFVDLYHNQLNSTNIVFYHNGFTADAVGSYYDNIYYVLKGLPVIIVDTDVVNDRIFISLTMWGFGKGPKKHFTVADSPYQSRVVDGKVDVPYYRELTDQILVYIKFILAYSYDTYNLIEYNQVPLFPQVAKLELASPRTRGCMLKNQEIQKAIAYKYHQIYSMVIGKPEDSANSEVLYLLENLKSNILHKLRLDYAESMKDMISEEAYIRYLDESIDAWVAIRSKANAVDFLSGVVVGKNPANKYISSKDKVYLEQMCACYSRCTQVTPSGECCKKVVALLEKTAVLTNSGHMKNAVAQQTPPRLSAAVSKFELADYSDREERQRYGKERSKRRNL